MSENSIALLYSKFGDESGKSLLPGSEGGTGQTTAGNRGTVPRSHPALQLRRQ